MIKKLLLSILALAVVTMINPATANSTQQEFSNSGNEGFFVTTPSGETYLFPVGSFLIQQEKSGSKAATEETCILPPAPGIYRFYDNPGWICSAL